MKLALNTLLLTASLFLPMHGFSAEAGKSCGFDLPLSSTLKRLFPDADRHGARLFEMLGAVYSVHAGETYLGVAYCLPVKTSLGVSQVLVAIAKSGKIHGLVFQKMESKNAPVFRSPEYSQQFKAFSLSRLPDAAYVKPPVRYPTSDVIADHHAIIEALKGSLVAVRRFQE